MKWTKNLLIATLLTLSLLLGACGESDSSGVSKKYQEQLIELSSENKGNTDLITKLFEELVEDSNLIYNMTFTESYEEKINEYSVSLRSLEFTPKTERDKEIDKLVEDVVSMHLQTNGATLFYLQDKTDHSFNHLTKKINKLTEAVKEFLELKKEYEV